MARSEWLAPHWLPHRNHLSHHRPNRSAELVLSECRCYGDVIDNYTRRGAYLMSSATATLKTSPVSHIAKP
jgi:hypothetical protein